ncbi:DUF5357 family protein [Leptolyngbya sp. PCC 6406]|uniref:DUF5357 family protein n=1 Tax=Leptolyngbya sp. PCC 6406 TaxID=1173264 RepID=UPI0002AD198D|nr:DUF5357 family protein [Leptolyngbya sp. PCC 6406]
MIKILQDLWNKITGFFLPQQYFAWQTLMYLALFSWAMSWIARFSGTTEITQFIITTSSWGFWTLGIAWFLEARKVRPFGIPIAPWVAGAIVCTYFHDLIPGAEFANALVLWPLVSVGLAALPVLVDWELKPKNPLPGVRQKLVLMLLLAVLFSSWFQFYFRLQSWLKEYPTLATDNFTGSGFVTRLATDSGSRSGGIPLLIAAEERIKAELNDTPWPWVERWLLNLNGQMEKIRAETQTVLVNSAEGEMWHLQARPHSRENGYDLSLMAVWNGPSSSPEGYYLEKICLIRPQAPRPQAPRSEGSPPPPDAPPPTVLAQVTCNLEIPKRLGKPQSIAG